MFKMAKMSCFVFSTAEYIAAVLPGNPLLFTTRHRGFHIIDRANPQKMDEDVISEVII